MEQETISLEWNYNYILLCTMNCKKSRRSAISVAALDAPRELKATGPFWRVCFAVPVRRCFFSVRETPALIALFLLFSRCKTPHNPYSVVRMVTTNVLRIPLPGTPAATACWTISPRGWAATPSRSCISSDGTRRLPQVLEKLEVEAYSLARLERRGVLYRRPPPVL